MGLEREVPIKQVVPPSHTSARCCLNEPTVERYIELYRQVDQNNGVERLPAIEAEVVQTGDPATLYYIVVDGLHRREAQVRLGRKRIIVKVTHKMGLIPDSVDSTDARKTLLKRQIDANRHHGLAFNKEDMRRQVRALIGLGETKVDISEIVGVSRPTLDKWFASEFAERRQRDEQVKIEYVRLVDGGLPAGKAAEALGCSARSCRSWSKRLEEGDSPLSDRRRTLSVGQDVKPLQIADPSPPLPATRPSECHNPPPAADSTPRGGTSARPAGGRDKQPLQDLTTAFNILVELPWTPAVEEEVKTSLFPFLCQKSAWMKEVTQEGGLSRKYETVRKEYDSLRAEFVEATRTISQKNKELAALREELKKREAYCSYGCNHTLQRVSAEASKFVRAGLAYFFEAVDVLSDESSRQSAAHLDLALNNAAKFLSIVEWALDEGYHGQADSAYAEFRERFMSMQILHTVNGGGKRVQSRDLLLRIRKCDARVAAQDTAKRLATSPDDEGAVVRAKKSSTSAGTE